MNNKKPRQLTLEQARDICDNFYVDWAIPEQPESRTIEIDTEEFGVIELSEEDYYKYYLKI